MEIEQKISLLKAMGIEVWRDRASAESEPLPTFFQLYLAAPNPILLLADSDPMQVSEEQNLVEAIAKALGFVQKVEVATHLNSATVPDEIIVMGEKTASILRQHFPQRKLIKTHSPSQLLKMPQLKAQTWAAIRHLKKADS